MTDILVSAISSGVAAGVIAVVATLLIEKLGGVVGGVLSSTPTTIIPAALGMAYRLDPDALLVALFSVPLGVLCSALFLLAWRILPSRLPAEWSSRKALLVCTGATISGWLVTAVALGVMRTLLAPGYGSTIALGVIAAGLTASLGVYTTLSPYDAPKGSRKVSLFVLFLRGLAAATSIGVAVALSALDDVVGGIATAFPSVFCTTMVALWISQGEAVGAGATGPMILGSTSVSVFSMLFVGILGATGSPVGAAVATWATCIACVSLPVAVFVKWRARVSPGGSSRRILLTTVRQVDLEFAAPSSPGSVDAVGATQTTSSKSQPPLVVFAIAEPEEGKTANAEEEEGERKTPLALDGQTSMDLSSVSGGELAVGSDSLASPGVPNR